jgi:hypothetical protein
MLENHLSELLRVFSGKWQFGCPLKLLPSSAKRSKPSIDWNQCIICQCKSHEQIYFFTDRGKETFFKSCRSTSIWGIQTINRRGVFNYSCCIWKFCGLTLFHNLNYVWLHQVFFSFCFVIKFCGAYGLFYNFSFYRKYNKSNQIW